MHSKEGKKNPAKLHEAQCVMLFIHLNSLTPAIFAHVDAQKQANIRPQEEDYTYFAGSLLLANLALLVSLVPLLLLKLADELRAVLLNQAHLDGTMVGLRTLEPRIVSLYHLRQTLSYKSSYEI